MLTKSLHVTLLATVVAISGCAVGPDFEKPQPNLPAEWGSGVDDLRPRGFDDNEIQARWWEQFGDPTLVRLIERAREANLDLRIALLRVAQSRAQRDAIAGNRAPTVAASAQYQRQRQSEHGTATRLIDAIGIPGNRDAIIEALSQPYDVYQGGFDASWEIDLWGRLRRAVESADASLRASEADLRGAELSLTAEVARTYLEWRGVQDQLRIAREDVSAAEGLLELTEYRAKGGMVTQLDFVAQRARLAESRSRIAVLEQRETQLAEALSFMVGQPPGALAAELDASMSAPTPPTRISLGIPSDLARRRPDIRAAEARLQAATADVGVAISDFYPRFTLTGGYLHEALRGGDLSDWGARQWSIGPSVYLPIFDGARRRSMLELREAQQQEAALSYQRVVLQAWHEIDTSLQIYVQEQRRNEQLREAVAASEEAHEIASTRYRHGLSDYLITLDAQRTLLQSQQALSESNTLLATRLVALYKALGGGWE